jgi:hypothetical protein
MTKSDHDALWGVLSPVGVSGVPKRPLVMLRLSSLTRGARLVFGGRRQIGFYASSRPVDEQGWRVLTQTLFTSRVFEWMERDYHVS